MIVLITAKDKLGVESASIDGARCIAAAATAMKPACTTPYTYPEGRGRKVNAVRRIVASNATRGTKVGAGDSAANASDTRGTLQRKRCAFICISASQKFQKLAALVVVVTAASEKGAKNA